MRAVLSVHQQLRIFLSVLYDGDLHHLGDIRCCTWKIALVVPLAPIPRGNLDELYWPR